MPSPQGRNVAEVRQQVTLENTMSPFGSSPSDYIRSVSGRLVSHPERIVENPLRRDYEERFSQASDDLIRNVRNREGEVERNCITLRCDSCNTTGSSSDLQRRYSDFSGELIRPDMLSDLYITSGNRDGIVWFVCNDCNYNRQCDECGVTCSQQARPRMASGRDPRRLCGGCMDAYLMENNLERCESCRGHFDHSDLTSAVNREGINSSYCQSCMRDRIVMPYNANPLDYVGFMGKPKDKLFYGVELEVENNGDDFYDVAMNTYKSVGEFAILKHDGSLNNGFEVVSAPMSMEVHRSEIWDKFFDKDGGRKNLRAAKTETCGMHVHVSRDGLSTMTVGKVLEFIHSSKNQEFIEVIAGRERNRYCMFANDDSKVEALRAKRGLQFERERYNGVNLQNEHTMEIRIFKGTLSRKVFLKNLEFCESLVKFAQNHSMGEAESYALYAYWVMNNRKTYPILASFLMKFWFTDKRYVANFKNAYTVERAYVGKALKGRFDGIKRKKEREMKAREDARAARQAESDLVRARELADQMVSASRNANRVADSLRLARASAQRVGRTVERYGERVDSRGVEVYNDGRVMRQGEIDYRDNPNQVTRAMLDYFTALDGTRG